MQGHNVCFYQGGSNAGSQCMFSYIVISHQNRLDERSQCMFSSRGVLIRTVSL